MVARDLAADLIVMGGYGRSGRGPIEEGSAPPPKRWCACCLARCCACRGKARPLQRKIHFDLKDLLGREAQDFLYFRGRRYFLQYSVQPLFRFSDESKPDVVAVPPQVVVGHSGVAVDDGHEVVQRRRLYPGGAQGAA